MIQTHISYNVGDGKKISLFHDNWLFPRPISNDVGKSIYAWGENLTVSCWWDLTNGWNIPRSFCRRYPTIVAAISATTLTREEDSVRWKLNSAGEYTVSSMYQLCSKIGAKVNWDKITWLVKSPPRFQICQWLLWKCSLKTKMLLFRRGVEIELRCVLCQRQDEDCSHLFFKCAFSNCVWGRVLASIGINRIPLHWEAEQVWIKRNASGRSEKAKMIKFALSCIVYHI